MDFCYISCVTLLFLPLCLGQENASFEVEISPDKEEYIAIKGKQIWLDCMPTESDLTLKWFKGDIEITDVDGRVYIEKGAAGSLGLVIKESTDDDNAKYTCKGSKDGAEVEASIQVVMEFPITVKSEKDQFGIVKQVGTIKCDVESWPKSKITWYRKYPNNTKTLLVSDERYTIQTGQMLIKDLTLKDTGKYLCDIRKPGIKQDFLIDFTAAEVPDFSLPPSINPSNIKVGDEVTIRCEAEGTPAPTYKFKRGEVEVQSDLVSNGELIIKKVTLEDEAIYTCTATNIAGSKDSTVELDVLIPAKIDNWSDEEVANEGEPKEITCTAKGDPQPSIVWAKTGGDSEKQLTTETGEVEEGLNGEITVTEKLILTDVTYQDAGTYTCSAFNNAGKENKTVKLTITYKPNFATNYEVKTFYGWKGKTVNMTCMASANPVATIVWYTPNEDYTPENRLATEIGNDATYSNRDLKSWKEFMLSSKSLMVTVDNDFTAYGEKYLCKASNIYGDVWHTVELKEALIPGGPDVSQGETLASKVTLKIQQPKVDGGQKVNTYHIEYHMDGQNAETKVIDAKEGETSIELGGLEPATVYVFKVIAENAVGKGPEKTIQITTKTTSVPERPNIQSAQQSDSPNSYVLKWKLPGDGGSPIEKFEVKYKKVKVNTEESGNWKIVDDIGDEQTVEASKDATSINLAGLDKDAYYEIRLVAHNAQGASHDEQKIIKTSAGAVGEEEEEEKKADDEIKGKKDDKAIESDGNDKEKTISAASEKDSVSSASAGSGVVIGIIIGLLFLILLVALVVFIVIRRRKPQLLPGRLGGKGGEEEQGNTDGKDPAEEEKLIKEDNVKTESEVNNVSGDKVIEGKPEEFEPDTKPEAPVAPANQADSVAKPEELAAPEPTTEIKITPETPEKPENPSA